MKLLTHEKYLIVLTLFFLVLLLSVSFFTNKAPNTVSPATEVATPYYVDINTASAAELDTLDGIGPAIAERIVQYRTKNGNFKSIEELSKVSGIGNNTLLKIKDYIVLNQEGSK